MKSLLVEMFSEFLIAITVVLFMEVFHDLLNFGILASIGLSIISLVILVFTYALFRMFIKYYIVAVVCNLFNIYQNEGIRCIIILYKMKKLNEANNGKIEEVKKYNFHNVHPKMVCFDNAPLFMYFTNYEFIIHDDKCKSIFKDTTEKNLEGFLIWNLLIRKRLKDPEAFEIEMNTLLISII